jgi:phage-related protein
MALQADISVKLDTGGLATGFTSQLTTFQGSLSGISVPTLDSQAFSNAAAGAQGDGGLAGSVSSIAAQLPDIVGHLGLPQNILGPILSVLELAETVAAADIEASFRDLGASMVQQFSSANDEGFLGLLLQASDLFGNSPQLQQWKNLLKRFTDLAGVQLPEGSIGAPNLVPGAAALVRLLGGLMAEYTIVSEAERLAKAAAAMVDADSIARDTEGMLGFFRAGGPSIEEQIAGTNTTDDGQVDVAVTAVRQLRVRIEHWSAELSRALAFGEATLLFMDVPAMQTDLEYAQQTLRQADAVALERLFASIAGALGNVVPADVLAGPEFTLNQFFDQVEGRVAQLAAKISSFSTAAVSDPLNRAMDVVLTVPNRLGDAIQQVQNAISAALETVRAAVAALPLDAIRNAIQTVLGAVTTALKAITDLVGAVKDVIQQAAQAMQTVLDNTDHALTEFRDAVKAVFHVAVQFVESLHLDQVVGAIADGAKQLADAIGKASMKPYFDTAAGAIGSATDVVQNVPFSLLPDSMEQEVVDAIRPVKTADVGAFQTEIEGLLQIGPDHKFALRPQIEAAAAEIQQKFDSLIEEIRKHDPRTALAQVDQELSKFGDKVRALSLQIDLSPIRNAIQQVHSAVQAIDPDAVLKPLKDGFDQVLAKLNDFSPVKLIEPVETRWNASRQKVLDLSHIPQWVQLLDDLKAQASQGLDKIDPSKFGANFDAALNDGLETLNNLPHLHAGSAFGSVVAALYQGSRLRVLPLSFEPVLAWMGGASGTADLVARAGNAAGTVRIMGDALRALDLPTAVTSLTQSVQSLRNAIGRLPAGAGRDRIAAELDALNLPLVLAPFQANHTRFFGVLEQTTNQLAQLSAAGFSEVDDGVVRLKSAWAKMSPVTTGFTTIFRKLGITGFDVGLGEVVKRIVAIAPPSRIIGILAPIFAAVHERVKAFVAAVIDPLRAAAQKLIDVFNLLTLTPLKEGLTNIHTAIVGQIAQFHPDQLFGEPLTAFRQLRTQVLTFDPVADIQSIIDNLAKAVDSVLKKLNLENLLAEPLQLYDQILASFSKLRPAELLQPVLDQLDRIASEVDAGLTETVTSFRALQDALPDHVGSTSISASASVSVA